VVIIVVVDQSAFSVSHHHRHHQPAAMSLLDSAISTCEISDAREYRETTTYCFLADASRSREVRT